MKRKLFNIIVYGLLAYSFLAGVHASLPTEYQIDGFTNLTALVSGASTALVGSAGLYLKSLLTKTQTEVGESQAQTIGKFLELISYVEKLNEKITQNDKLNKDRYQVQLKETKRLIKLVETDLQAKLSNKLIDEKVRELIEGVLDEEEVV